LGLKADDLGLLKLERSREDELANIGLDVGFGSVIAATQKPFDYFYQRDGGFP
jgi:hypothetical protein